jgi:hypothetical protein
MDFNLIDTTPMAADFGQVWQGSTPDAAGLATIPGPLVIVCMEPEPNEQFVDHVRVHSELYVGIEDDPSSVVPDSVLRGLADAALAFLSKGFNLYVHCAAGVSRASYVDCAIHQRQLGWTFDQALAYVRASRPQANPNSGFVAQLDRLGPLLSGART